MEKMNTEEKELRTRVLVGLSGGKHSYMAAYLLKIQKYDVMAATVVQDSNQETKCSINSEELQEVKDFCKRLGIPHFIIDGNEPFGEFVQEKWISSHLEGRPWSSRCGHCQNFRMELLYQKMKELDAEFLSTGHFAKIIKMDSGHFHVHSVHDLKIDQSAIVQKLSVDIKAALILPLASMGMIELEKLSEHFSLKNIEDKKIDCFSGEDSNRILQDYSKPIREEEENHSPLTVNQVSQEEKVPERISVKLGQVDWAWGMKKGSPFKGFIYQGDSSIPVRVYPKTLSGLWIECEVPWEVGAGEEIAIYQKKGGGAKLLLEGVISLKTQAPLENEEEKVWTF